MWSHGYVGEQNLVSLWTGHDWRPRQILFKLLEGENSFFHPFESLPFIQQEEEGPTPISRPRNKTVKGSDHAGKFLDFLGIPKGLQAGNSPNLIKTDFDSPVGHHIAQEFP